MAFALSLSGINGAARALDVIGNNIANTQTVGFKASKARFADVLAASTSGSSQETLAAGVASVGAEIIRQQFTQGNTQASRNPLDMTINGQGFFRLEKDGEVTYTRDGQFQLGYDPASPTSFFLINQSGRNVTGYAVDYAADPQGVVNTATKPAAITIEPSMPGVATTAVAVGANLNAQAAVPTLVPFNAADNRTFNSTTGVETFDAAGTKHDLRLYFVKGAAANQWDIYSTLDGGAPTGPSAMSFDTAGKPVAGSTSHTLSGITFDFSGSTQYGVPFSIDSMVADGYASGTVDSADTFSVAEDGVIWARYSNDQSRRVGQIVLANFVNPDALIGIGDGQWIQNLDPVKGSGKELLDTPGRTTGTDPQGMGSLQGSSLEVSNVDLNTELVAMIEQQRNYQASAQAFKILDQVMQNLANLQRG